MTIGVTGRRLEGVVGAWAHGGHAVLRPDEGPVVFVRHALPGERVVVEVTEGAEGDRFWRGDAVEVLDASPDRVEPPCPVAGPGLCGGCDLQHASLPAQRSLKTGVVREQLARLAGLTSGPAAEVEVEAVPGDVDGLRWRTRQRYVDLGGGRTGMRKHRSHEVVEVEDCLIDGRGRVSSADLHTVRGVRFEVPGDGFWQVHLGAAPTLVDTVLDLADPQPGETVLDLYAGVGLFARFLAEAVGDRGRVGLVEGSKPAVAAARRNLADTPAHVEAVAGDVRRVLGRPRGALLSGRADLVVLDPPREGARKAVCDSVARRRPSRVVYVACDPAALARDVAYLREHGYELAALRAFDLFPMTHHVECVALLRPSSHF